jgi:hypothetical protein
MSLGVRAPRLQHADGESTWVVLRNTVERGCDTRIGLGTLRSCQTDRLHSTTPRSCKLPPDSVPSRTRLEAGGKGEPPEALGRNVRGHGTNMLVENNRVRVAASTVGKVAKPTVDEDTRPEVTADVETRRPVCDRYHRKDLASTRREREEVDPIAVTRDLSREGGTDEVRIASAVTGQRRLLSSVPSRSGTMRHHELLAGPRPAQEERSVGPPRPSGVHHSGQVLEVVSRYADARASGGGKRLENHVARQRLGGSPRMQNRGHDLVHRGPGGLGAASG